jgi:hypothetical protein
MAYSPFVYFALQKAAAHLFCIHKVKRGRDLAIYCSPIGAGHRRRAKHKGVCMQIALDDFIWRWQEIENV